MDDEGENYSDPERPLKRKYPQQLLMGNITRSPMMRKMLTAQIKEEMYHSLECRGLFLEEQKGWVNSRAD